MNFLLTLCLFFTSNVLAHPGHIHNANDFFSGLLHPFSGIDHIFIFLITGMISFLMRKISFIFYYSLLMLICGLTSGYITNNFSEVIEILFICILIILNIIFFKKTQLLVKYSIPLFFITQGWIHGVEATKLENYFLFFIGLIFSSIILFFIGLVIGKIFYGYKKIYKLHFSLNLLSILITLFSVILH